MVTDHEEHLWSFCLHTGNIVIQSLVLVTDHEEHLWSFCLHTGNIVIQSLVLVTDHEEHLWSFCLYTGNIVIQSLVLVTDHEEHLWSFCLHTGSLRKSAHINRLLFSSFVLYINQISSIWLWFVLYEHSKQLYQYQIWVLFKMIITACYILRIFLVCVFCGVGCWRFLRTHFYFYPLGHPGCHGGSVWVYPGGPQQERVQHGHETRVLCLTGVERWVQDD